MLGVHLDLGINGSDFDTKHHLVFEYLLQRSAREVGGAICSESKGDDAAQNLQLKGLLDMQFIRGVVSLPQKDQIPLITRKHHLKSSISTIGHVRATPALTMGIPLV